MSRSVSYQTRIGAPADHRRREQGWRWMVPLGAVLLLPACAGMPGSTAGSAGQTDSRSTAVSIAGPGGTDAAILDACRQRANEIYDRQNRAEIYAPQSGFNSPLSGTYVGNSLTRGLSSRFGYEQLLQECIRTANVSASRADAVEEGTSGTPAPVPPPVPPGSSRR